MLLHFKVSNFLSFDTQETFSMIPSDEENLPHHVMDYGDIKLLKLTTFFGANAAGKSNFIKAMEFARSLYLDNSLMKSAKGCYSKSKKENQNKESIFEFTFMIHKRVYSYGFSCRFYERQFVGEWLYAHEVEKDQEVLIFERNTQEETFTFHEEAFPLQELEQIKFAVYQNDFASNPDVLFVRELLYRKTLLQNTSLQAFFHVDEWFRNRCVILHQKNQVHLFEDFQEEKLLDLLAAFDVGIEQFRFHEIDEAEIAHLPSCFMKEMDEMHRFLKNPSKKITYLLKDDSHLVKVEQNTKSVQVYRVDLMHYNMEMEFQFSEESDGVRRLFDYLDILMEEKPGTVYIVDELSRSLHPLLSLEYIQQFAKLAKDKQLVFSTHETMLLNQQTLRKDEIWFVERLDDGTTRIYSLDEFKDRLQQTYQDSYLMGRYGAIPFLISK